MVDLLAPDEQLDQADLLRRALALARRVGLTELAECVVRRVVDLAQLAMSAEEEEPGVTLPLLGLLVSERTPSPELDDLLARARRTYTDAFQTAETIRLQVIRARGNPEQQQALRRESVEAWFKDAESAVPAVRLMHLERAAQLARDFGFRDLEERAAATMQSIQVEELGLKHMRGEFSVPAEEMERYFGQFTDAPTWQDALRRLASIPAPSGELDENQRLAHQIAIKAPLANLFTMLLGGDGLPRFTAATDEEKAKHQLQQVEQIAMQLRAPGFAEVLRRIHQKWGPIDPADLANFLGHHSHVSVPVAASLARALGHFWRGDFEAAAYVAVPRIEALIRAVVLALGAGIYRAQREKTPGQYPGLGALLPILRNHGLDPSWIEFLSTFFSDPGGINYRNELSHGFLGEVGDGEAALVLVAALYLAVRVIVREQPGGTEPQI